MSGLNKSSVINWMEDNRQYVKSVVLNDMSAFITFVKDKLRVDYYSQVDGLTGDANDDILNKIQACTESANETINNNCAILKDHQNELSNKEKQELLNANVTLQRFKVESKIWYDILMSKDGSKDADIYKFKDKSKVEMKNETATEEIFQ